MNAPPKSLYKVLFVEDDPFDAMLISKLLQAREGSAFEVQHVQSLAEAVECLGAGDYDVALIDLALPDGNGIESLHLVRSFDARIPVVLLTGMDDEELGLDAINTGAQDCLAKNHISGQMLFRVLRFAIARQGKMLGLQAAADTDPLTEMPNRRFLEAEFIRIADRAACSGAKFSLGLLDVDHFKNVNDRYGHLVGDSVLRQLASFLRSEMPAGGVAARYGGEEFAIVLPRHEFGEAEQELSALVQKIANADLETGDGPIRITVSGGVAEYQEGDSLATAFRRADEALYEAKNLGRNRVRIAPTTSATGFPANETFPTPASPRAGY